MYKFLNYYRLYDDNIITLVNLQKQYFLLDGLCTVLMMAMKQIVNSRGFLVVNGGFRGYVSGFG